MVAAWISDSEGALLTRSPGFLEPVPGIRGLGEAVARAAMRDCFALSGWRRRDFWRRALERSSWVAEGLTPRKSGEGEG